MGEFNEETTNGWAELGKPTMGVKHLEAKVNPRLKEQDEELIIRSQREPQERDACQELQLFIRRCSHPQTEVWWGGKGGGSKCLNRTWLPCLFHAKSNGKAESERAH